MPAGTPIRSAIAMLAQARIALYCTAWRAHCSAGWPDLTELPSSPASRFAMKCQYCPQIGWSRPICTRIASICSSVASEPAISMAGSPGIRRTIRNTTVTSTSSSNGSDRSRFSTVWYMPFRVGLMRSPDGRPMPGHPAIDAGALLPAARPDRGPHLARIHDEPGDVLADRGDQLAVEQEQVRHAGPDPLLGLPEQLGPLVGVDGACTRPGGLPAVLVAVAARVLARPAAEVPFRPAGRLRDRGGEQVDGRVLLFLVDARPVPAPLARLGGHVHAHLGQVRLDRFRALLVLHV